MDSSKSILLQAIAAGISPRISLLLPTKLSPPGLHIPPLSAWREEEGEGGGREEGGREERGKEGDSSLVF